MDQVEHLLVSYYLKLALRDPDRKTQSSQDEIYKSLLKKGWPSAPVDKKFPCDVYA
jgi:hypothetical protein